MVFISVLLVSISLFGCLHQVDLALVWLVVGGRGGLVRLKEEVIILFKHLK